MSKYASKWEPISSKEYFDIYNPRKEELSVYSSYSNPGGNDGMTETPQMHTTWGDNEKELIKSIGKKETWDGFESTLLNFDYDWKYWKAVEWESDDD